MKDAEEADFKKSKKAKKAKSDWILNFESLMELRNQVDEALVGDRELNPESAVEGAGNLVASAGR